MSNLVRRLPSLTLVIVVAACGGDSTGPEENGRQLLADPSFAEDVNEIFQRKGCASGSCHGAPNGQGALVLTANAAANYAAIVNVPADGEAFDLVEPGNADDSYIVIKVEGRQTQGATMPQGGTPLDAIDLGNLRNWINNGAPNN